MSRQNNDTLVPASARTPGSLVIRPILALFIVSAVWGSHPVIGKAVESQLSPLALTVWRFTFVLVLYFPFWPRIRHIVLLGKRTLWRLAFTSLCWSMLYPLFYYQSLKTLSPVDALLLVNMAPLVAALFAFLFLRERLRKMEWAGIVVAFGGVLLLMGRQVELHTSWMGFLLALLATVSFAAYSVSSRRLFQELALFDVLLATSIMGAVFLWVYTLLVGQFVPVAGALWHINASGIWQFGYIALFVSTLAYILYGYGLGKLPAAVSSAITFYPEVVFAALIEWAWFGQVPTGWSVAAALCILAGTFLMGYRGKDKANNQNSISQSE